MPRPALKPTLDGLLRQVDWADWRANDPVELVWGYEEEADREVVALLASSMAYGRVSVLKAATCRVLEMLGPAPASFLAREDAPAALGPALEPFVYRMTRGADVLDLLAAVGQTLRTEGSLEALYLSAPEARDHLGRTSHMVRQLRARRLRPQAARGLRYLIPDPADGGACKRLHLFLRWMVRGPDAVDLGVWRGVDPAVLRVPLDTHTSRICRYLGMTSRKSNDGKTVEQVTEALRALDPKDPIRYDFALCHLGVSKSCVHRRSEEHCPQCPLEGLCTLA